MTQKDETALPGGSATPSTSLPDRSTGGGGEEPGGEGRKVVLAERRRYAGLMLAADIDAAEGLITGEPVPRHRLVADVLAQLGEPPDGAPVTLDDALALRVELARPARSVTEATAATVSAVDPPRLQFVSLDEFVAIHEQGADALLGEGENALIPEGGDVMLYGDGGAGKTTLAIDLACHLAAGDRWLGIAVPRPVTVLVVENEGPRPHFRRKLRRKLEGWTGSPIEERIRVLEEPWAQLVLDDDNRRQALADAIRAHEADVVILGPVTRSGMNEAGTLQQVRDFMLVLALVRRSAGRAVAFILVHHENKGGTVSGAWEGAGDTLLHVQAQGHGQTRLYIQKARWSSSQHATTLQLAWAEGEGFTVRDEPERDENTIADELLEAVRADGGASWNTIQASVPGKRERLREIRDRLLAGGRLIDVGGKAGMKLWHADDPARPATQQQLSPGGDSPGTHLESAPGETVGEATESPSPGYVGTRGSGTHPVPPSLRWNFSHFPNPGVPGYLDALDTVHTAGHVTDQERRQLRLHHFRLVRAAAA